MGFNLGFKGLNHCHVTDVKTILTHAATCLKCAVCTVTCEGRCIPV